MTTTNDALIKAGKKGLLGKLELLTSGLETEFPKGTKFDLAGETVTREDILRLLKADATLFTDVTAARTVLESKILAKKEGMPRVKDDMANVKAAVTAKLGRKNPRLASGFGLPVQRAARERTADQKAASAAKGRATRAKRGTLGKRQRLAIAPATLEEAMQNTASNAARPKSGSNGRSNGSTTT
jgi:hypothetical protein